MKDLLTEAELETMNEALRKGRDVEVQRTRDGIRIIEKRIKVLDKKISEDMLAPRKKENRQEKHLDEPVVDGADGRQTHDE